MSQSTNHHCTAKSEATPHVGRCRLVALSIRRFVHSSLRKTNKNIIILAALSAGFAPQLAFAQSLHKILGYLEIFVGLFLTASLIMFAGALLTYFARYGTPRRAEVFPFMEWAITIVFVLIVLLGLVEFFQKHTTAALYTLGVLLFFLLVILLMKAAGKEGEAKDKIGPDPHPVPPPTRR